MISYEELVAALSGETQSSPAWPGEAPQTLEAELPQGQTPIPGLMRDPAGTAVDSYNPAEKSAEIDLGDVLSDEEI
jgi:hypothetical protein